MLGPADIWQKLGGRGDTPARLGRYSGAALILGGGRNLWDDVARVRPWAGAVIAVNDAGAHYQEGVAHWVTLHPEYLPGWRFYRRRHCYDASGQAPLCHASRDGEGVDIHWELERYGGTSGLFAAHVALMLGYSRVVLAGVPMDNTGHYFDPPWARTDNEDRSIGIEWEQARDTIFGGRVKSLSGRTRDWLGAP